MTEIWDVIVIGTGMGGGTLGRRLAEAGQKVLFLEYGPMGAPAEEQSLDSEVWDPVARRARGFWPDSIKATVDGHQSQFFAPLGAAVGGSSVFYAATLERPAPHDLDDSPEVPHPTGGWPVGFDDFAPYFALAEQMYSVNGGSDPLGMAGDVPAGPDFTQGEAALVAQLKGAGLHAYQAHMALRHVTGCQTCLGRKCPKSCKMDGRSAGVLPALETGHATLLDHCEVLRIEAGKTQATHIVARHDGQEKTFAAKQFVLSAGALSSPRLLMASQSVDWPDGIGNQDGLVGRNLMFHMTEMLAVWGKGTRAGASKAIALRDFYLHGGQRLGMLQAMGIEARYGEIVHFLNGMFDRSALGRFKALRHLMRIPAAIAVRLFGNATIFAGILEDLPYAQNRVLPGDQIAIEYTMAPELLQRRKLFRKVIKRGLKGMRKAFVTLQPELNFGHPCGTTRFGNDPRKSVLDPQCRVHGMRNLWVVDAGFMPTSMGVNPSLTIAANALRVADLMMESRDDG